MGIGAWISTSYLFFSWSKAQDGSHRCTAGALAKGFPIQTVIRWAGRDGQESKRYANRSLWESSLS